VNRWLFDSYDLDADYRCLTAGALPERPFLYIATASHKDPGNRRLAPLGHTNL